MIGTSSIYDDLSRVIVANEDFTADARVLLQSSLSNLNQELTAEMLRRVLQTAAIFACSTDEKHKALAQRIASLIIEKFPGDKVLTAASELVLLRLGNFPMLEMSIRTYGRDDIYSIYDGTQSHLTPSLATEVALKTCSNEVEVAKRPFLLTDFQSEVHSMLVKGKNISISAPTSSGKSFVLLRYGIERLAIGDRFCLVYIVPTRALISEIQREFRRLIEEFAVDGVQIVTTSWQVAEDRAEQKSRSVMILTPERLQSIQGRIKGRLDTDLLIVDEAHRIEEGGRGIILEGSVQLLIKNNPGAQIVFISPNTGNPEKLGDVFLEGKVSTLKSDTSPITQNVWDVECYPQKLDVRCICYELGKTVFVSEIPLSEELPRTQYRKKAWLATHLISTSPTMIFCNGPDDCRNTARAVYEYLTEGMASDKIGEVVRFLSRYIHPKYYLIDYLSKGVGFHYGPMPASVKMAVESLFMEKEMQILCCTSTLSEGVNFPAKNILIYKPMMGKSTPMKELGFWNLAGRAGRLMKDFSGNVYCIDKSSWGRSYQPEEVKEGHTITSSMEEVIRQKKEVIIEHLKKYSRISKGNEDVEAAVTRFIISEIRKENEEFVGQLLRRDAQIKSDDLESIVEIVRRIASEIDLGADIMLKNSSIDPRLQNRLYIMMREGRRAIVPHHPSHQDFYKDMLGILEMTAEAFDRKHERSLRQIAWICKSWTTEMTLGEIIRNRIDYVEQKQGPLSKDRINDEIEDMIKLIHNTLSYSICRDVACYMDVLTFVLEENHMPVPSVEKLAYYIEMGASKPTTLTLLNNGIPRTPAIVATRRIGRDNIQDYEECKRAILRSFKDIQREIPSVILDRIQWKGPS
jgi:superfamily II DNA/RNA helicase